MKTGTPSCRHFRDCGGCSCLETPIAEQLAEKASRVRDLLAPYLDDVELRYSAPETPPRHYRTRILYPAKPGAHGEARLGIYRRGTHEIVEVQECQIQHPALTRLGTAAGEIFRGHRLQPYDETRHRGFLRAFSARVMPRTRQLLMGLITTGGLFPKGREIAEDLMTAAEQLPRHRGRRLHAVGVVRNINEDRGNALLGRRSMPLVGRDYLEDKVSGLQLQLGFNSFYQLHGAAQQLLYARALTMLGDVGGLHIVDAFGGVGAFGLRLAASGARQVTIVEEHPDAARDARRNAKVNRLPNVTVENKPFATFVPELRPDLMVVDPTRAGLRPDGLARIRDIAPPRLLYVACSASSLARDLAGLGDYQVDAAEMADLFSHTDHVELIVHLHLRT